MPTQNVTRYSAPMQLLHWLTAILVIVAFIFGPGGSEERVYSAARDFDRQLHETLGICVLALVALRLVWRMIDKHPELPASSRLMEHIATAVQISLYALLFAVPLSAIAGAWLEGHELTLLWEIQIQSPLSEQHALGKTISEIHTWLGDAILWIAGLHAAAAVYHHIVLKDGVLISMLPFSRKG